MHITMKYNIVCFLLCLFLAGCFGARQSTSISTSSQTEANDENAKANDNKNAQKNNPAIYDNQRMTINHKVFDNNDKLKVYLELDIPRLRRIKNIEQMRETFIINYGIRASYTSTVFTDVFKIDLSKADIKFNDGKYYLSFDLEKKPVISSVVLVDIVDTQTGQKKVYDLLVNYTIIRDREKYGLFNQKGTFPLFTTYLLAKDTVQVRDLFGTNENLTVSYYNQNFNPASPPMATGTRLTSKVLSPDSIFTIQTNRAYNFDQTGVYLVRSDTTNYFGLSFFVANRKYPKLSKIRDLINPLVYITTKEEIEQLENEQEELKKTMDKFWLKLMSGDTKKAKFTIREYYQRVKLANDYFTTYKPGWQTDMGMIFIVYGNPNRIIRNNEQEFWIYTQNASFAEIKFEFLRKPNQFTDYNYVLKRYPDYEQVWYPAIELWREGKIQ